jgi:hypothetical protein
MGVVVGGLNSWVGARVATGCGITPSIEGALQATRDNNSKSTLAFQIGLNKVNSAPGVEERIPRSI